MTLKIIFAIIYKFTLGLSGSTPMWLFGRC